MGAARLTPGDTVVRLRSRMENVPSVKGDNIAIATGASVAGARLAGL